MIPTSPTVEELFARWRTDPSGASPEELCHDFPELLPALQECINRASNAFNLSLNSLEFLNPNAPSTSPENTPKKSPSADHFPTIRGYTIHQKIGQGGQGVVYLATQHHPRRQVAIKILLNAPYASSALIRRFEREIELVATLRHPNIVTVFASGKTDDGYLFCAMDYAGGIPLTHYIRDHNLTLEQTLSLFTAACDAVNHAHQKGVMHRDLKPANMLVDPQGNLRVLDFGLAKQTELSESQITPGQSVELSLSTSGQILGTLPYMSPEQTTGNPDQVDIRTDVYALGVILYEILTGDHPYPVVGQMADILHHIAHTQPKPLTQSRSVSRSQSWSKKSTLDNDIQTITLKALAKERERRYQTAGDMGRDITRYLHREPIEAKRDSTLYVLTRLIARHRLATTAAAIFILLLAASSLIYRNLRNEAVLQRDAAHTAEIKAEQSRQQAINNLVDMYTTAGLSAESNNLNGYSNLWFAKSALTATDDPDRAHFSLIRYNNWIHNQSAIAAAFPFPDPSGPIQLEFAPLTDRVLMTRTLLEEGLGECQIWDLPHQAPFTLPLPGVTTGCFHGASALLGNKEGQIADISIPSMSINRQWKFAGTEIAAVASDHSSTLLSAGAGKTVYLWRASSNDAPATMTLPGAVQYLCFSPDNQYLLAGCAGNTASLFRINSDTPVGFSLSSVIESVSHHAWDFGRHYNPPQFVNNGDLVTLDSHSKSYSMAWYQCENGQLLGKTDTNNGEAWNFLATPDGKFLSSGAGDTRIFSTSGSHGRTSGGLGGAYNVEFGSSGRTVVVATARDVRLRAISAGVPGNSLIPGITVPNGVLAIALSRDEKYVAEYGGGYVRVWRLPFDASSLRPSRQIPSADAKAWGPVAFFPDGLHFTGTAPRTSSPGQFQFYDLTSNTTQTLPISLGPDHRTLAVCPTTGTIAMLSDKARQLSLWSWPAATAIAPPIELPADIYSAAFAPDGHLLAVHLVDGRVFILDAQTLKEVRVIACNLHISLSSYRFIIDLPTIAFSRDGHTLYIWGMRAPEAREVATGKLLFDMPDTNTCWSLEESPDGSSVATSNTVGHLHLFSARTHALTASADHPSGILNLNFAPDGHAICTAGVDTTIRLFDAKDLHLLLAIPCNGSRLSNAQFAPDSRCIVSTNYNTNSGLYDSHTGFFITPPFIVNAYHQPITFSPDGRYAALGGPSAIMTLLDIPRAMDASTATPEQALLYSEIIARSRIDGVTAVPLTSAEWGQRYNQYRQTYGIPDLFPPENAQITAPATNPLIPPEPAQIPPPNENIMP